MRILISSHRYAPDIGGIETVSALLAHEWHRGGHVVSVVTATPQANGAEEPQAGIEIYRRPIGRELRRLVAECDVCWHNNISLQTAWPLLFTRRPWVVTTQTWLHNPRGRTGWNGWLKRLALRGAHNVAISRAVAEHVGLRCEVIPNPYASDVFRRLPGIARERELAFVGRLVSDKGCDVLLRALHALAPAMRPRLTIIGGGPEEMALRAMSHELGLAEQVQFAGWLSGTKLASALNAHRVLVVPSRWSEPFGIVALEGMACGCQVIASHSGGLVEAVGPGGEAFENGNVGELAAAIRRALTEERMADFSRETLIREHLAAHGPARIAARYLEVFTAAGAKMK